MKKKIAYILVALLIAVAGIGLGVSAFNNLNSNEPNTEVQGDDENLSDEDLMKKAVAYVKTIYKDVAKETAADFERIGTVPVGKAKFTVDWSVDVDETIIKVVKQDNGMVTIDINEEIGDETPYILTATISDGKGNKESLTWDHVIPAKITGSYQEIVDMAYALKNGESLPNVAALQGTVTAINTAWDPGYKNITVTIVVEGREDKPIQCYRLQSGAADASKIEKGDLITVTGTLKNYNGTIEFDAGCTLDENLKGQGKINKISGTYLEIVAMAYKLKDGESLKGEATLAGSVISVDTEWSDQYNNITVTIVVDGSDKAHKIKCYRLASGAADAKKIKAGDWIKVTGVIKNYKGTIEFDQGCVLDELVKGGGTVAVDPKPESTSKSTPATILDRELMTGDKVVIYNPKYGKALSTLPSYEGSFYNKGIDITIDSNGKMSGHAATEIFTVTKNIDGTYSFSNDNKNIGMKNDKYTSMAMDAVYDDWNLIDLGKGYWNIENSVRGNVMEWYAKEGSWSAYDADNATEDDMFRLSIYLVEASPNAAKTYTVDEAKTELESLYANVAKKTADDYKRIGKFKLGTSEFTVSWEVKVAEGLVASDVAVVGSIDSEGYYPITVNKELLEDTSYTLVATVKDSKGATATATWEHYVPAMELNEKAATKSVLYLFQKNLGKNYYFNGQLSGNYLDTTPYIEDAVVVTAEKASDNGEYYLTFVDEEGKKYISMETYTYTSNGEEKTGVRMSIVTSNALTFTLDENNNYTTVINNGNYVIGTSNSGTYSTFGTVKASSAKYNFVASVEEVLIPYKLTLFQETREEDLFFNGLMCGYYLDTTTFSDYAVDVYLKEVKDTNGNVTGVYFYFYNEEGKVVYINIVQDGTYFDVELLVEGTGEDEVADITVATTPFVFKKELNTYVKEFNVDDEVVQYYIGTYNNFNTFSPSDASYIKNATSYPAILVEADSIVQSNEKIVDKSVMSLKQTNIGKTLYFSGKMNGNYLDTTDKIAEAVEVTIEPVTENGQAGIRYSFMDGKVKKYIEISTYTNKGQKKSTVQLVEKATMMFVEDTVTGLYVAELELTEGNISKYFLGTYSNYDTISACEISRISTNFVANVDGDVLVPYKFNLFQPRKDATYFFTGEISGKYLQTSTKASDAVDIYVEEVKENETIVGVRFYFYNADEKKTYIEIVKDTYETTDDDGETVTVEDGKIQLLTVTEDTIVPTMYYTFNSELNTYVAELLIDGEATEYYIGTYSTYTTFSASKTSYIDTSYPAYFTESDVILVKEDDETTAGE